MSQCCVAAQGRIELPIHMQKEVLPPSREERGLPEEGWAVAQDTIQDSTQKSVEPHKVLIKFDNY